VIVLISLLAGFRLVEETLHRLWGPTEYLFFGTLRVRYIFDAADLALLAGFLGYGAYSVIAAYVKTQK